MSGEEGVGAVQLSRLPRRGVLLGQSAAQLTVLAVGLTVLIVGVTVAGGAGLLLTAPIWTAAAVIAWVPVGGRPLVGWVPTVAVWGWRRAAGQTSYRPSGVLERRPAGSVGLPGDAAAVRLHVDPTSGVGVLHDPHEQRLIAVAHLTGTAFILTDPAEQRRRTESWGRVLATACRSGRIGRLQVLERTLPGSGTGLAGWWATTGVDDGSWVARTYTDLIGRAGPATERHDTMIAVGLDLRAAARPIRRAGGGLAGAMTVLRHETTTLTAALTTAELGPVGWATPDQLARTIRTAYDPHTTHLDTRPLTPVTAGPLAVEESWSHLRSDSGWHAVLWIAEWPRTPVPPSFLAPLLLSAGITRTFTLICEPIPTARAVRQVRRVKTEQLADAAHRARIGQVEDLRDTAAYADVCSQEADLAAGHGLLRYAGLITITAPTDNALEAAVAEVEQAAVQAGCDTRRLVGQQHQAFQAAALPLCRGI